MEISGTLSAIRINLRKITFALIFTMPFIRIQFLGIAMTEPFLRLFEQPVDKETERGVIQTFLPETVEILKNPIRAGIINLLVNSPNTGHSMKVEQLAYKLGTYHRIIIYHLERLQKWKLITVKKNSSYGNKTKRSIWGLDLKYPNWVSEVYSNVKESFE